MALRFGRCRLPELLKATRMSQTEFAKRLEVSDSFVSRVISGEKKLSLLKAREAALILGCHVDDLYEWIGPNGERL
ncbi:helix-turn-helix transcriptional regulator [Brevibacillus borstelensis]|uniref:helix-turn-helix transcriptional regulator n=1 Tax=Brevibacillus borstelensis TaxID=45462 RepID=UPI00399D4C47